MSATDAIESLPPETLAAQMFADVLRLPTEGARFTGADLDNDDIGVNVEITGDDVTIRGTAVGRVTLTLFFAQRASDPSGINLANPVAIAVGIPNMVNFGARDIVVGSFSVDTGRTAITAHLREHARIGEIAVSGDRDDVSAVNDLADRLVDAAGVREILPGIITAAADTLY